MPPPPTDTPSRKAFALSGRSAVLDPATHAVRADLADVRLAEMVFAPHYAAAMPRIVMVETDLRVERAPASDVVAKLMTGESFEVLDLIGDAAWGIAPSNGLVGYVTATSLGKPQ